MQPPAPQTVDASSTAGTYPDAAPKSASPRPAKSVGLLTRWKFGIVRAFLWAWARTFSLKGLYLFGRFFGTIEYTINFNRRRRYRRELARVFPDGLSGARQKKIILNYFRRTRCDKLLYLIFDRLPREKILRRIKFHGRRHLDAALACGSGVSVLLSHHGSHHVAALLMALLGYKCAGVRDRNEGALRLFVQQKYAETFPEFADVRVLYADSFPREIFRCFRENRVVGSALDVNRDRGGNLKTRPVRIFGESRAFLSGPLQIPIRCGAVIVQGFVVSRPNFYFRLIVTPPLFDPAAESTAESGAQIDEIMQKYANGIEAHVREHPDHLSRI